jgi:hypothetical protein
MGERRKGEVKGKMTKTKYKFSRRELMEKDVSDFSVGDEIEVGVGARYKVVVAEKRVKTGTVTPLTNRAGKCNVPEYIKDFIHGFRG